MYYTFIVTYDFVLFMSYDNNNHLSYLIEQSLDIHVYCMRVICIAHSEAVISGLRLRLKQKHKHTYTTIYYS